MVDKDYAKKINFVVIPSLMTDTVFASQMLVSPFSGLLFLNCFIENGDMVSLCYGMYASEMYN